VTEYRYKQVRIHKSFLEEFLKLPSNRPVETFVENPLPPNAKLESFGIYQSNSDILLLNFSHPSWEPLKHGDTIPVWEVKFRQERKEDECKAQTTCTNQTTGGTTNGAETADTSKTV